LILCDSRIKHDSGALHEKQKEAFSQESMASHVSAMVDLCRQMHKHLIRGELLEFGRNLDTGWRLKRNFSPAITSPEIDQIYDAARSAGALGGKLLGAGAGGFFLFFVQPQYRQRVSETLRHHNCKISNFRFESGGVTSWRTKVL
jgi:D-glycero-alpha-D-manno-heptose-7-phosphate kinase